MSNFAIGIATYNQAAQLNEHLQTYAGKYFTEKKIFIYDNGNQQITIPAGAENRITVMPDQPLEKNGGVSWAWNHLCRAIFAEHDYALILNDDINLGMQAFQIADIISKHPNSFIASALDWCAFIVPKMIYQRVGPFDEGFFAYFEDNDYAYRLRLAGQSYIRSAQIVPKVYKRSSTMDAAPGEFRGVFQESQIRYAEKWGGAPFNEKFTHPFNKKSK